MASEIDAETFYMHQRSIAEAWGIALPPWEELSWDERVQWDDKLLEQEARDREHSAG